MKIKNKKSLEKIINVFLNIMLVMCGVILLISIYVGIQSKYLKNDYSNFFGYTIFEVQTGSMEDAISIGDWVLVKLTKDVKINDIVTYKLNDDFITHRVVEIYNGNYIAKGDANNAKDDPIQSDQIVGKGIKVLKNVGFIKKTLLNPAAIISIFITLLLFDLAMKKERKQKKIKEETRVIQNFEKFKNKNLEDTLFYKVTPEEEIDIEKINLTEEVPNASKEEIFNQAEEEMQKTMMYRVVPVDASEIEDTLLEIEQNKVDYSEEIKETEKTVIEEETEEEISSMNIEILEILKSKKNKNGDNVLSTFIYLKTEEMQEIYDVIFELENLRNSENTIRKKFIDAYIDIKYYNCYENEYSKKNYKNSITKVEKLIKPLYDEWNISYKGKNGRYREFLGYYYKATLLFSKLEKIKETTTELKIKKEKYKEELTKNNKIINVDNLEYIVREIIKIQRKYALAFDFFINKVESKVFDLEINKLNFKDDVYGVNLNHKVNFSKVYSDYIIDKTYSQGVVAEDKTLILLNLLSVQLIKDINSYDFNNKYIFNLPESLFAKEKKLEKTLKIFDDKFAKEKILILLNVKTLNTYKLVLMKLKRRGFRFAVGINSIEEFDMRKRGNLFLMNFVLIDKKLSKESEKIIPEDLKSVVIHENICEKINDFSGE